MAASETVVAGECVSVLGGVGFGRLLGSIFNCFPDQIGFEYFSIIDWELVSKFKSLILIFCGYFREGRDTRICHWCKTVL